MYSKRVVKYHTSTFSRKPISQAFRYKRQLVHEAVPNIICNTSLVHSNHSFSWEKPSLCAFGNSYHIRGDKWDTQYLVGRRAQEECGWGGGEREEGEVLSRINLIIDTVWGYYSCSLTFMPISSLRYALPSPFKVWYTYQSSLFYSWNLFISDDHPRASFWCWTVSFLDFQPSTYPY